MGVAHEDAEDNPLEHAEPSEPAGVSVDNHIEGNLDEINWLPADASPEWREGVKASLELKQFGWDKIVEESWESFEQEEVKRAATEAKFKDQLESDLISAAGQSLYEGRRDRLEQAAGPAHPATQLIVQRTQVDRRKVNGDELAERRRMAEKQEVENQKQRDLVEARRKAAERIRTAVMALIDVKRAQAEDGSRRNKGRSKPWQTTLSAEELELVKIEILLERARVAGVNEVELQRTLQACGAASQGSLVNDGKQEAGRLVCKVQTFTSVMVSRQRRRSTIRSFYKAGLHPPPCFRRVGDGRQRLLINEHMLSSVSQQTKEGTIWESSQDVHTWALLSGGVDKTRNWRKYAS